MLPVKSQKSRAKPIKYNEGQWFAVPLLHGGYALGIVTRGCYRTKGGLGYFFGQKFSDVPVGLDTYSKNKDNAILIRHFGDLGIIQGDWPLIQGGKAFTREEWPVPLFHRILPVPEGRAVIVDYGQDYPGLANPIRETHIAVSDEVLKLPLDRLSGYMALQITLTKLIDLSDEGNADNN